MCWANSFKAPFVTVGWHDGLKAGDAFLLGSDGLWQWFKDTELAAAVARNSPRQAAERLVGKACRQGGGAGPGQGRQLLDGHHQAGRGAAGGADLHRAEDAPRV